MTIKTASPGIVVNEVDLTRGTSDAITTNVAAFAGPFAKGPVDELKLISTEAEFQRIFGDPTDGNYEYWWTVSNYLEYGGVCYVIRTDDSIGDSSGTFLQTMRNATDDRGGNDIYVKNEEDFVETWYQSASVPGKFLGQNPGTWANGLGVAVIDHGADLEVSLKTTGIVAESTGIATADNTDFVSGLTAGTVVGKYVKVAAPVGAASATLIEGARFVEYDASGTSPIAGGAEGFVVSTSNGIHTLLQVSGTDIAVGNTLSADGGTTESDAVTEVGAIGQYTLYSYDDSLANKVNVIWTPDSITLTQGGTLGFTQKPTSNLKATNAALGLTYVWSARLELWVVKYDLVEDTLLTDGTNVHKVQASGDWYTAQTAFAGLPWYRFASRPGTSQNAIERGAANDELNIIIYDHDGSFTGSKGNTLETYFGVSKLVGSRTQEGDDNYYINVINNRSAYLFANHTLSEMSGDHNDGLSAVGTTIGDGINAKYIDVKSYVMADGEDNYNVSLGELQEAYNKLTTENVPELDYIIQGPGMGNLDDSVAKANFLISICEDRKDCMCFLSPYRSAVIGQTSIAATENIILWADELSSSSYAVIDSGYKYTYDRFNDQYRNIPLNGDIAGLMVNTSLTAEAWYSPAGLSRGQIRNVVKLPYNPSKTQRDQLYTNRVNPVVTFPGEGTILFGDKTALGYSSAFDRINVRKLFLVIEREIAKISRTTLFEFNDDVTRSLFKNNVNPYLRDVQAKRGMYDFLVVCDTSNNTPEVIDRNEFIADIYIKPAKSVNFISLNFIATKTGVSFDESVALFRGS